MPRVLSEAILRLHYEAGRRELDVVFTSGRVYRYFAVPADVYQVFLAAESKGRFFNAEIRDCYDFIERT